MNNDDLQYDKLHQEKLMRKFKSGPEFTRLQFWLIICGASVGWMVAILIALLK